MRSGRAKTEGSGKDAMNEGATCATAFMVKNIYTTVLYRNKRSDSADRLASRVKEKKREF